MQSFLCSLINPQDLRALPEKWFQQRIDVISFNIFGLLNFLGNDCVSSDITIDWFEVIWYFAEPINYLQLISYIKRKKKENFINDIIVYKML